MTTYYLNSYRNDYTEEELFLMIQKLIKKDYDVHPLKLKKHLICYLVKYIESERLLDPTLDLLEDFGVIEDRKPFEAHIEETAINANYCSSDILKIKAICFSEVAHYTLNLKEYGKPDDTPELSLNL